MIAQQGFEFNVAKGSLPKNNTTSVPEMKNDVYNSPQNKMLNYLMPLGL